MLYHFFQMNLLQNVVLISLLCILRSKFHHSRYVLIDVYDEDDLHPSAGCGDWCWWNTNYTSNWCTGDPKWPYCNGRIVGVCVPPPEKILSSGKIG